MPLRTEGSCDFCGEEIRDGKYHEFILIDKELPELGPVKKYICPKCVNRLRSYISRGLPKLGPTKVGDAEANSKLAKAEN